MIECTSLFKYCVIDLLEPIRSKVTASWTNFLKVRKRRGGMRISKFTLIASRRPSSSNLNEELQWLGGSLGLFNRRDKDKSCFRVFIILLKEARRKGGVSSDEIADQTGLTRGTVVHHLNKLMHARLVNHENNHYVLMVRNLEALINSVQRDVEQTLSELRDVAREIDRQMK